MATSEEHLRRAVDEVLDPVWASERRRMIYSTVGRVGMGVVTMWVVAFGAHLVVHENFPWVYFGVITLMGTTIAALMNMDGSAHLEGE
jgi:hypothetical protein